MLNGQHQAGDIAAESETLVLVDQTDPPVGYLSKALCHRGIGVLHRAFSLFILGRRALFVTRLPLVRHAHYAPFSQLLSRSAALVHHGGIGTAAHALKAGVPQLVAPCCYDQFDNAAHLRRLGVSRTVARDRYTPLMWRRSYAGYSMLLTCADVVP
jgi:hypothetical protein